MKSHHIETPLAAHHSNRIFLISKAEGDASVTTFNISIARYST